MKHTTQKPHAPAPSRILTSADLARVAGGDVYLHEPKGSNDRLNGRP